MKSLLLLLFCVPIFAFAQEDPASKLGPDPIYVVDSVKITKDQFQNFNVSTVASVQVLTDADATNKFGNIARDGAILIQTKALARRIYIRYFRKKSPAYDSLYMAAKTDSAFQYIINDKIKDQNSEGDLSAINDKLFISLEILTADDLKKKYNITDKLVGVLIKCRKPQDVFNGDSKF